MKRYLKIIVFIIFGMVLAHVAILVIDGFTDNVQKADVIVVFGNKVESDGTPSRRLQKRLDQSIVLFNDGFAPLIFVSGGVGKSGYPEGDAMASYLIKNEIPKESIIVDNDGINTKKTIENIQANKLISTKSVLLVSNYYHLPRARYTAKNAGIRNVYTSHARAGFELRDLYSILREIPANYLYRLR